MGIYNKTGKVIDYLGENAVQLSVSPEKYVNDGNEAFRFQVTCKVKGADLAIKKSYLKIKALETVTLQYVQLAHQQPNAVITQKEARSSSHQTFCQKFIILQDQVLVANKTYNWVVEVVLPQEVNGTYRGYNAQHEWKAHAGLDIPGDDPISEWVSFEVRK